LWIRSEEQFVVSHVPVNFSRFPASVAIFWVTSVVFRDQRRDQTLPVFVRLVAKRGRSLADADAAPSAVVAVAVAVAVEVVELVACMARLRTRIHT
jgi:hypothetical protein